MLEIVNYNKDEYDFPALVVLGCFDAIHIGHAELLKKAKLQAKINGLDLGVMMFSEGKGGRQVFTFDERLKFLEGYNTKFVLKIDYTEDFKSTAALDFLHNVEEHVNVKAYMSGKDFRFGAGAKGKSSTLKNYAEDEENGVWYMPVKDIAVDGEKVSTTLIKQCIGNGEIQRANALLGREYFVSGEVCEGHGRGRSLGFPTANIVYPADKVLVKSGVYGVEAEIDGTVYKGVANCGPRPTFGEEAVVLEVYFENLSEDLYGRTITVRFLNYIRGIKKFESAEELSAQISRDAGMVGAPDNLAESAAEIFDESGEITEAVTAEQAADETIPSEAAIPEEAASVPEEEAATEEMAANEGIPAEETISEAEELVSEQSFKDTAVPATETVADEARKGVPAEETENESVPEEPVRSDNMFEESEDACDPEGVSFEVEGPAEAEAISSLVEEVFEGEPGESEDATEGVDADAYEEDLPETGNKTVDEFVRKNKSRRKGRGKSSRRRGSNK